jgi:hypothetical protein
VKEGRRVEEVQEVKECKEGCQDSVVSGQWPVVRSSVRNCAAINTGRSVGSHQVVSRVGGPQAGVRS